MSYTDDIDEAEAEMTQDRKEREKREAGEPPHQRYFTAAIFVIDYEPEIDTFWTKEEAEQAAIKFWNQAYGLKMETREELDELEMRSGDFCWIKPVLIPVNRT